MVKSKTYRPNLFIVGAMKSGTTSLHHYLNRHPQIFMSDLKEPGFFVEEINWGNGEGWYLSLFSEANDHHLYRGESSTDYTKLPIYHGVPERLKNFAPEAKIIYIIRDPFARIISHYWFAVRHISTGGLRQNFYTACKQDPQYISFSNYPLQIQPYLELFGRDRVLLLLFEDLVCRPKTVIRQVLTWLELEDIIDETILNQAWNTRPDEIVGVGGFGVLNSISYSKPWDKISPCIPKPLKNIAKKLALKKFDPEEQQPYIDKLHAEIYDDLFKQTTEMSNIMGRNLHEVWSL